MAGINIAVQFGTIPQMQQSMREISRVGLREKKKRQTREELLSVAQTLFTNNEFSDVTVDQIVEMANVSQKTFFNYFQNKAQFLEEYMLDWLKGIGFWSISDSPVEDCRSSLIPTDAHDTLDWIVDHRRILKMAMQQTTFLDFIYKLDTDSAQFDAELHAGIRRPRLERVMRGQLLGVVRKDVSADEICKMYDALRIDAVRRWLYLPDDLATREILHERYEMLVECFIQGIEARTSA